MTAHALAIPATQMPAPADWTTLREMAGVFLKSGLLPASIKTPEAALTVMLKARELGIPPLYGLSNIVVVQGKPVCSAELMLALLYRDQGDNAVVVEESSAEVCRVSYRRRGWDKARAFAFTIEDARRAGLAGKGTWAQYPQAMLRARCISAVARMAFPDSIGGLYTPDEMGAPVTVSEDGAVEIAAPPAPNGHHGSRPATVDADGVIHDEPAAGSPLLAEALDLAWRCRGAGLTPMQPTATATDAQLRRWMDHWAPKLAEAEAASEREMAGAAGQVIDEDEQDAAWDRLGEEPQDEPLPMPEPGLALEVSGPKWATSSLGRDVSAVADQLTEAGKRFSLPPDAATEAELTGWLSSKRALLGQRGAK